MAGSAMAIAGSPANASAKAPTAQRVRLRFDPPGLVVLTPAAIASVMSVLLPYALDARYVLI
ncbi:hypothetical protein [Mycobacterium terramassiliense]|uniref:hypothetical protein n=1 Tax=Mycobacterium terramassiliense TaxID=1841859 RepID=UPI00097CF598|nr:hypothetical protein [Mycobacterium terramassiliense]